MSRFLERQLRSATSKPLGRAERFYEYDAGTDRFVNGVRRADAATKPPLVTQGMTPVGRTSGVCKPGMERAGERAPANQGPMMLGATSAKKYR